MENDAFRKSIEPGQARVSFTVIADLLLPRASAYFFLRNLQVPIIVPTLPIDSVHKILMDKHKRRHL